MYGNREADGVDVMYYIQYAGTHPPTVVTGDTRLPDTTVTVVSDPGGLEAELTAFTASDTNKYADFTCGSGWRLDGRQGNNIVMNCYAVNQDSAAWEAIYSTTTNHIIAATCSYCGLPMAPNRWETVHAQLIAGDTDWMIVSASQYLQATSTVTSGSLTASTFSPVSYQHSRAGDRWHLAMLYAHFGFYAAPPFGVSIVWPEMGTRGCSGGRGE